MSLTPRERQSLEAYAQTTDQREAARRLGISYQTFKNHLRRAYAKLGAHNSIAAFRKLGWLRVQ